MAAPLPYYQWHPNDYLASPVVTRMTVTARGCYRELLDWQWREGGLDAQPEDLQALIRATDSEWAAFAPFLDRLFPLDDDGARRNPRMALDRAAAIDLCEARQASGSRGGRPRRTGSLEPIAKQNTTESEPSWNQSQSESKPNENQTETIWLPGANQEETKRQANKKENKKETKNSSTSTLREGDSREDSEPHGPTPPPWFESGDPSDIAVRVAMALKGCPIFNQELDAETVEALVAYCRDRNVPDDDHIVGLAEALAQWMESKTSTKRGMQEAASRKLRQTWQAWARNDEAKWRALNASRARERMATARGSVQDARSLAARLQEGLGG